MTKIADNTGPKSVLFVERESEWQERFRNLPLGEFDISIEGDFTEALNKIYHGEKQQYHVIVTNIDFSDTESDKKGFLLARILRASHSATQIIFLDRRDPRTRVEYAKIIFGELRSFDYLEKDMFDPAEFIETLRKAIETAESEQRIVVLEPKTDKRKGAFTEIIMPLSQAPSLKFEKAGENTVHLAQERMNRVRPHIKGAKVIVADLRYLEPNVYYETGIAHGYHKNVIIIAGKNQIHEMMTSLPRIEIPDKKNWKETVRFELKERIEQIFSNNGNNDSNLPDTFAEDPTQCLALIPDDDDSRDTYDELILPVISGLKLKIFPVYNEGYPLSLTRIRNNILKSHLVIIDFSQIDVFLCYCAGYAIGLNKKVMFITQKNSIIPDDFKEEGPVIFSKRIQAERNKAKENIHRAITDKLSPEVGEKKGDIMKKVTVFINHASEDDLLAKNLLYDELIKIPWIDPWLDDEKLLPGQNWELEINKALEASDAVMVCMSKTSINKVGFVQAEIYKAEELQKRRPPGKIYIIPVLLGPCDVPFDLKKYQWVDITMPGKMDLIIKSLDTLR